jgi:hypothetical protein
LRTAKYQDIPESEPLSTGRAIRRCGEMRHAEPTRQGRPISRSAAYLDVSALDRLWKIDSPEADGSECRDHSLNLEVHLVARILHAQIDLGTRQDEPVGSILVLPKTEENDDTLIGEIAGTNQSPAQSLRYARFVVPVECPESGMRKRRKSADRASVSLKTRMVPDF